mgnify:CR=1
MKKILIVLVLIVVVIGAIHYSSKNDPKRSQGTAFGTPTTFTIGQTITFADGLKVTLVEINDSRCKPDVQCIWAGELSPLFRLTDGIGFESNSAQEVRLGITTAPHGGEGVYRLELNAATESSATITITRFLD